MPVIIFLLTGLGFVGKVRLWMPFGFTGAFFMRCHFLQGTTTMTAAAVTWQQRFVNRFVGRVIRDANQRLYLAFDAMIRARGCPVAQRNLAAAQEHEQRFGGKTCFGGKLAAQTFETAPQRRSHFGASVLKSVAAAVRAVMPTRCEGNARASAPRTRQTGSNATKTAAGDSGDPDPERPHAYNPATTGLDAASFGGEA